MHSECPKLYEVLAVLSAIGLKNEGLPKWKSYIKLVIYAIDLLKARGFAAANHCKKYASEPNREKHEEYMMKMRVF